MSENCEEGRASSAEIVTTRPVPKERASQLSVYSDTDDLRAKLAELRVRVETGNPTKATWLTCKTIDPESKKWIIALSEALLQSRELMRSGKWDDFELVSDCLLQRYLSFIVQGDINASPYFNSMLWAARERYRSLKRGERFWRVPPSFMDALLEQMTAKADKIESMRMAPPDYSRLLRVTPQNQETAMKGVFVAPENGYIFGIVHPYGGGCITFMTVNEEEKTKTMACASYTTGIHPSFFYPLQKGQKFMLTGGDCHRVTFVPCKRSF